MDVIDSSSKDRSYSADKLAWLALATCLLFGAGSVFAHPTDVCMPVTGFSQVDETTLSVALAIEKTPELAKLERGGNDEKRFFVRWAWSIFNPLTGDEVTTLFQEVELMPPWTTVLLPHCERPGEGDGSGGAAEVEHVELTLTQAWGGTDAAGELVPDGDYPYALAGELVRAIETGNPNDDHVNELVIGEFGPEQGSFTIQRLSVTAQATPEIGPVPLAVLFSALVEGEAVLFEWDFDGDGTYDYASPSSAEAIYTYTAVGVFEATLRATSAAGTTVTSSVTITATEGLVANVLAHPTSGTRPLKVRLTPEAFSTGPSVTGYRWDFNGDGVYDTGFDARPSTRTYTYNQAGVYNATLQVRDATGRTAEDFEPITVSNPPPTVEVEVVPSNGPAPLDVTFVVTAGSLNGPITSVVIDPGDGSAPITLSGSGSALHTYTSPGTFNASVTVTDAAGETATVRDLELDIRIGEPGAPTAVAVATPDSGAAPLMVTLISSGSFDADGTIVLYEWDFDFDGTTFTPDTTSATPTSVSHTYSDAGTHFAALRVTDDAGLAGLDVVSVFVNLAVTVTVPDDTINPYNGETVNVRTVLTAGIDIAVYLRNRAGNRVRTLFSGFRVPGTYDDAWDGFADSGALVLDGDYYAEAEYQLGSQTFVEPDTPSGGLFRFVSWSQNYSNGAFWDPWEDQFWELTFDTAARSAGASEVTLWITPYSNRTEITATLLNANVFGSGRYRQWWDGVKDNGQYVEPRGQRRASGNDYLWSAQAFTLPDNTIVVEGGRPLITGPSADPNVYYPTTHRCLFGKGNEIAFTLSRDSSVTLRVFHMGNGNLLRVQQTALLTAGPQTIEWDGKAQSGDFAAPGRYRAELTATSENGNVSLLRRVLILVTY